MDHYAVIGNPIHHSLSPRIHQMFAAQVQHVLTYQRILAPLDGFKDTVLNFQQQGGKGLNITLPFKQQAFELVAHLSERAQQAKAVNTICFSPDGSLFGDNTDGIGLIRDLIVNQRVTLENKQVLILGAGGAVRGVLLPILQQNPSCVTIANRSEQKASELAQQFKPFGNIKAVSFAKLSAAKFDIVINGTSAGLQQYEISLPDNILAQDAVCYDMTYGKGSHAFMSWAKKNNALRGVDGLGMLVEQAAESFYLWRQQRPDTRPVIAILRSEV